MIDIILIAPFNRPGYRVYFISLLGGHDDTEKNQHKRKSEFISE